MHKKNKALDNECSAASPSASEMAAHLDAVTHSQWSRRAALWAAERPRAPPPARAHARIRARTHAAHTQARAHALRPARVLAIDAGSGHAAAAAADRAPQVEATKATEATKSTAGWRPPPPSS